jgi:hypothetical protein
MTPNPPERDAEQREDALHDALIARRSRHDLLQRVNARTVELAEVLDVGHRGAGDHIAGRIQVADLVMALDGVGPATTAKILAAAGVQTPEEHLDELTADQVQKIKTMVDELLDQSI